MAAEKCEWQQQCVNIVFFCQNSSICTHSFRYIAFLQFVMSLFLFFVINFVEIFIIVFFFLFWFGFLGFSFSLGFFSLILFILHFLFGIFGYSPGFITNLFGFVDIISD